MHQKGIGIILHCFDYGRGIQSKLNDFCEEVHYYPRRMNKLFLLSKAPFIVKSRENNALVDRLLADEYPILYEGLHSCASINHPLLGERGKFIRAHNVEHHYYEGLSKAENRFLKSKYLKQEARKLEKFEEVMKEASAIISISPLEENYFKKFYKNIHLVFPFHGNHDVHFNSRRAPYSLYHGNLAVPENEKAARFLVNEVFSNTSSELKILGSDPSPQLMREISKLDNVELDSTLDSDQIIEHIKEAQVNVLPTFQSTGVKLKLLNALFNGGHCLVNTPMIDKTGLENTCRVIDDPVQMSVVIEELMKISFDKADVRMRKQHLMENLSDEMNAERLIEIIFES